MIRWPWSKPPAPAVRPAPLVLETVVSRQPRRTTPEAARQIIARARGMVDRLTPLLTPINPAPLVSNAFEVHGGEKAIEVGGLALDWMPGANEQLAEIAGRFLELNEGIGWLGWPYLAQLMQRPEYRTIVGTHAQELTREWIALTYAGKTGAEKPNDMLDDLKTEMETFGVQELFREIAEHDGAFGRAHLFPDLGTDTGSELTTPLSIDKVKIGVGSLKGFRTVEPIWVYPLEYNSTRPLSADYYNPIYWNVQGDKVHRSRLLTFVSREVPDILKPSYMFGGISLSQLSKPYVDNFLIMRQAITDLVKAFSVFVYSTELADNLDVNGLDALLTQIEAFNTLRDNMGLFVVNKDTEELTNVSAPVTGLAELLTGAIEQMSFPSKAPPVKLFGLQPAGLNADSDGVIRTYYDTLAAEQVHLFRAHLMTVIKLIQLNKYGKIDPAVGFRFVPLWQLDEAAKAAVRKTEADTDSVLIDAGVLAPEEARERLAADEEGPYNNIDISDLPEPPDNGEVDAVSPTGNPAKSAEPSATIRSGV